MHGDYTESFSDGLEETETLDDAQEDELPSVDARSFYSILNISPDSTDADIYRAYKGLAVLYHPDKHPDAHQETAAARFREIQRAFDVLSTRRAVYDVLGEEGLKTTWEVGQKFKSAAELKAEYENMARERRVEQVNALVRARGEMTIQINAQTLFDRSTRIQRDPEKSDELDKLNVYEKISNIHAINLVLKNTFHIPVNAATRINFTQTMLVQRKGRSGGNLTIGIAHRLNEKINLNASAQVLRPNNLALKGTYAPDQTSYIEVHTNIRTFSKPAPIVIGIGTQISKTVSSFATLKSGHYCIGSWGTQTPLQVRQPPSLTIGLNGNAGWSLTADTSVQSSQLHLNYSQRVLDKTVRIRTSASVDEHGQLSFSCGAERRLPLDTTFGMTLLFSANGVNMRLSLARLGQRISLPILMCTDLDIELVATSLVVPACTMVAMHYFYLRPRKRRKVREKLESLRQEHKTDIQERQKDAEMTVAMLQDQIARRKLAEHAKDGLIIDSAEYGPKEPCDGVEQQNVAIALQALVANSQLIIPAGKSKSGLLGFYDSAPGVAKRLIVNYTFGTKKHTVICDDFAPLAIPLRNHLIDP